MKRLEDGYAASYLWTTHELHSTAHLYKRAGFQLTEQKESAALEKSCWNIGMILNFSVISPLHNLFNA